jgi:hypothetical protein
MTEITEKNVYTYCDDCGREMNVDLADAMRDNGSNLESTVLICPDCNKRRRKRRVTATFDGINLATDVLCRAGFAEMVYYVLVQHGVEDLKDLPPEQYEQYVEDLCDILRGAGL